MQEKETPSAARALWPPAAATHRRLGLAGLQGKQWVDRAGYCHVFCCELVGLVILLFEEIRSREVVFDGLTAAGDEESTFSSLDSFFMFILCLFF